MSNVGIAINQPFKKRIPQSMEFRFNITNYDVDNLYPQKVKEIILASPIANRATLAYSDFLRGNGFEENGDFVINDQEETINDLLRLVTVNKALYNGYSIHVNVNILGGITDMRIIPFEYVRYGLPDVNGRHHDIKINVNWESDMFKTLKRGSEAVHELPLYGNFELSHENGMAFYVVPDKDVYPRATADPVLDSAQTECEVQSFELGGIQNGFLGTSIFRHPGKIESKTEREKILNMLRELKGPAGANGIGYVETNPSFTGPLIENIPANNNDTLFIQTVSNVTDRILLSFGMPQGIIGIQPEGGIFNQQDMEDQYVYYNVRTRDVRNQLAEQINKIMRLWHTGPVSVGKIIESKYILDGGRTTINTEAGTDDLL